MCSICCLEGEANGHVIGMCWCCNCNQVQLAATPLHSILVRACYGKEAVTRLRAAQGSYVILLMGPQTSGSRCIPCSTASCNLKRPLSLLPNELHIFIDTRAARGVSSIPRREEQSEQSGDLLSADCPPGSSRKLRGPLNHTFTQEQNCERDPGQYCCVLRKECRGLSFY